MTPVVVLQVTWESRHHKLQTLLRAAARRGYPASGEGMKWTKRAEKWGGLAPPPRAAAISTDSLRRSAQRIVLRAAKRGWDLRPSTGQSRPGSGGIKPADGAAEAEAAAAGSWSSHDDGEGNTYYVNDITGESAWEIPATTPAVATAAASSSTEAAAAGSSWSARDDGEGNTYYVNEFTGESVWEIPTTSQTTAATGSDGFEDWGQTTAEKVAGRTGLTNWSITAAEAGEGEAAAWWDAGDGGGWDRDPVAASYATGAVDSLNPFDGENEWPTEGYAAGGGGGYGGEEVATPGWEMTINQQEGMNETEDWTQEWDEGSQSYYWYNSRTGESQW